MKKYFTYIATVLALAACSSEDSVTGNATGMENVDEASGIVVKMESPVGLGDENVTRSTLIYDDAQNKMVSGWEADDCIGVFALADGVHQQQQKFTQVPGGDISDPHKRWFQTPDQKMVVEGEKDFVAYIPYKDGVTDYTKIDIDYTGQMQTDPVDFSDYWGDKTKYSASQPKASKHLNDYDYSCTGIITSSADGKLHLDMKRVGAIVRFWIVIDPSCNYVYDELQLVNKDKAFTTVATMNAATKELTPVVENNMISLKLGEGGFDLTVQDNDDGKSTTPFYWYSSSGKYTGYIMAYMMMAPIDLTGVDNCTLYLVAHDSEGTKHYLKSEGLSKPNLKANSFYKWTCYPGMDDPIKFSEITVQDWKEGTEVTNGDEGTGTEAW